MSLTFVRMTSEVYESFVSQGSVAPAEGESEGPVSILRETSAAQSLMVDGLIPFPDHSLFEILLEVINGTVLESF